MIDMSLLPLNGSSTETSPSARAWGRKEICYYASFGGNHYEQWSAKSLERGIGGSETAVVELARRWQGMGWHVTVFGDPGSEAGVHDSVIYRPWYEVNWSDTFNILILWRNMSPLDQDITARKLFVDLHDIFNGEDWTARRIEKVDRVFFKSRYQRFLAPHLPDAKVAIVSNGI